MSFAHRSVAASLRLTVVLVTVVLAASLYLAMTATGQLRDSFEGRELTWQLSKEADCGVRIVAHDRSLRESHSGQSSERFRLTVGNGTFVPLVTPIGRAPIIPEFRPTLYIKADRPSLQLMARVVFPRNIDRATGQPIASLLRGDFYSDVGQWQQLAIGDVARLLEEQTRVLRTQFGSSFDAREAYVDLIVLNAYSAPGTIDLWIDDLEINGYVNLDDTTGPQVARRVADSGGTANSVAAATVQGSMLMVRGRPLVCRAVQHRGEPLEWLKSLGFNTIKLSASPSQSELNQARQLQLWLIAPPPYADQVAGIGEGGYDVVIAWSLGSRLADRDLAGARDLATEIRNLDHQRNRPLLAGVDSGLATYSRLADLLQLERANLSTSHELCDLRQWQVARSRMARPGAPVLATIQTQRPALLGEQLILFGRGAAWEDDVDPQLLRLQVFQALAAGARGFVFPSESPLAIDNAPAALRTDALRLINMELRMLEPWIAAGQLADELATGDGGLHVSVLTTDRSRLLLLTQRSAAQQYVLGPPPRSSLSVVVPGVGIADKAYLVTLSEIRKLNITHTSSGARIVIEDAPHAAAIVVTQDHLAMHHLHRTLHEIKAEAARLRYDVTARRLAHTSKIDTQLSELGHPLPAAAAWISQAHTNLQHAQRLLEKSDFTNADALTLKSEELLARVRRGHWEQTATAFRSPAASPCIAQFTTLPLHWTVANYLSKRGFGPNVQAAGDMESLDGMLKAGWQRHAVSEGAIEGVSSEVSLSLADPHDDRSALRLQAWAADPRRAAPAIERPPVWVTSSPVPVRQGQFVQIRGWVNVPRPIGGSTEGLLAFDSIGGAELGDRIRLTQGWREFTLYRAVPQNGELAVTFALTGVGEASIDDLSVSLIDPEPIRPR